MCIDVIIPVYNGSKYILTTLDSINKQTLLPNRIIVIDDGSKDDTVSKISSYDCKIPLTLIKKHNTGVSDTRNVGIRESSSEFLAFVDADDVWHRNKLHDQMNVFHKSDDCSLGVVYCRYDIIDVRNNVIEKIEWDNGLRDRGNIYKELQRRHMVTGSMSAVIIKKECFNNCGLFDTSLAYGEDHDIFLRIAQKYKFDYVNNNLVHIRRHDSSAQSQKNKKRMFIDQVYFYNKWLPFFSYRISQRIGIEFLIQLLSNFPDFSYMIYAYNYLNKSSKEHLYGLGSKNKFLLVIGFIISLNFAFFGFCVKANSFVFKRLIKCLSFIRK